MIIKIMEPAGSSFPGVQYNDKKVENGKGELMLMKNFPSFINEESSKEEVKNYLASVSKSTKVKKPQFHAAISTKFQDHTKEELTRIAEDVMEEMGYGDQPYLVVFHNDTENNHIHIVSTRVDKHTGKKINDSFEKLKAQKALSNTMEKLYGLNAEEKIEKLLGYRYGSLKQLDLLLERNGFRISKNINDENTLDILKNGVVVKTINGAQLSFNSKNSHPRVKQLKAILSKYKTVHANKVFKVEDRRAQEAMLPEEKKKEKDQMFPKIEFESELQKKLRDTFGIDIVFHHKEGKSPFGYTLIDHKTGSIYKGSELIKTNELFEFTSEVIDKRLFESLKDYNISDGASKQILIEHLKAQNPEVLPKDFMLFENNKRKSREQLNAVRSEVKGYLKTQKNKEVQILKSTSGEYYAIHSKLHYVGKLESLLGEKEFQQFLNPISNQDSISHKNENLAKDLNKSINELIFELNKSSGGGAKDPAEEENKRRRKRKK